MYLSIYLSIYHSIYLSLCLSKLEFFVCSELSRSEFGSRRFCFVLCLFVCLFILYLFMSLLFVCFNGTVCQGMCLLCVWARWREAISVNLFRSFNEIAPGQFVYSGFAAGCDKQLAFLFYLLLSLLMLRKTVL